MELFGWICAIVAVGGVASLLGSKPIREFLGLPPKNLDQSRLLEDSHFTLEGCPSHRPHHPPNGNPVACLLAGRSLEIGPDEDAELCELLAAERVFLDFQGGAIWMRASGENELAIARDTTVPTFAGSLAFDGVDSMLLARQESTCVKLSFYSSRPQHRAKWAGHLLWRHIAPHVFEPIGALIERYSMRWVGTLLEGSRGHRRVRVQPLNYQGFHFEVSVALSDKGEFLLARRDRVETPHGLGHLVVDQFVASSRPLELSLAEEDTGLLLEILHGFDGRAHRDRLEATVRTWPEGGPLGLVQRMCRLADLLEDQVSD